MEKTLYPSPRGLKVGETVLAAPNASILIGNCLPFQSIPLGTSVHNVELTPGCGGQCKGSWLRSSNCSKEGNFVTLRLPSGEVRLVNQNVGQQLAK
jgi:large subunit ribosomal protein L2